MTPVQRAKATLDNLNRARVESNGFDEGMRFIEQAITAAVEAERAACASLCEEACLDVGASALEAEGVGRRTRDALAKAIRARSEEKG